jgi:hypothetical protein
MLAWSVDVLAPSAALEAASVEFIPARNEVREFDGYWVAEEIIAEL